MKNYRDMLREVLRAIDIVSPTSYRWFGVPCATMSPQAEAVTAPQDARAFLRYALKNRLYADFYCPGVARPSVEMTAPRTGTMSAFLRSLSEANCGSGSRDPGWKVLGSDGPFEVVERLGLRIWAHPTEVTAQASATQPTDATVALTMPKELFRLSPGFYMALGDCEFPEAETSNQIRFYWNLGANAAIPLMQSLTKRLNQRRVPFRLKVIDHEAGYSRTDAGVLYSQREAFTEVSGAVEETYNELNHWLKSRTPAFAQELAPGLGFAESPSDPNESFGTARCEQLAEGILRAQERHAADPEVRMSIVEACFVEAGVSLDTPYLRGTTPSPESVTGP
jgi:hypothetical protein